MAETPGTELRALRDRPFDLLRELERRSKVALAGASGDDVDIDAEEWVGIGFRLADEQFIVARDDIREVLMVPALIARVPGAKPWIRGLANVRGQLLPIIDLKSFLGAGRFSGQRDARVLVMQGRRPVGRVNRGRGIRLQALSRCRAIRRGATDIDGL